MADERDLKVGESYSTDELGKMMGIEIPEDARIVVVSDAVPYANVHGYDDGSERGYQWFALCPSCNELILLDERKDEESFTKREYVEHWQAVHGG